MADEPQTTAEYLGNFRRELTREGIPADLADKFTLLAFQEYLATDDIVFVVK